MSSSVNICSGLVSYFADKVFWKVGEVVRLRHQLVFEEIGFVLNWITVPYEQLVEVEETEVFGPGARTLKTGVTLQVRGTSTE